MQPDIQKIAGEREEECRLRAGFFESRLRIFSKANWITVLVPSLLGVVAGSAIFADDNSLWLGIAALMAALLTAIHKGLNCDAHQQECRRLVQEYSSLELRYRTLRQVEKADAKADLLTLEENLAELRKSQETSVKSHILGPGSKFMHRVIVSSYAERPPNNAVESD